MLIGWSIDSLEDLSAPSCKNEHRDYVVVYAPNTLTASHTHPWPEQISRPPISAPLLSEVRPLSSCPSLSRALGDLSKSLFLGRNLTRQMSFSISDCSSHITEGVEFQTGPLGGKVLFDDILSLQDKTVSREGGQHRRALHLFQTHCKGGK